MKFKTFEQMKEKVKNHAVLCEQYDKQRTEAQKEINAAKAKEQELMNRHIEQGEDVIDELARARVKVTAAEERYKRLIAEIGEKNPPIDLKGASMLNLSSEIHRYPHQGMREDIEAELKVFRKAREQVIDAYEKLFVKFYSLRDEARGVWSEAQMLMGENERFPNSFFEYQLGEDVWIGPNDAYKELQQAKERAKRTVEGSPAPLKSVNRDVIVQKKREDAVQPVPHVLKYKRSENSVIDGFIHE